MPKREDLIEALTQAQRALKAFDDAERRLNLRTDEPPKLPYPRLLYKGAETLVVKDQEAQDAAVAEGWFLRQGDGLIAEPVAEPKKAKKA